MRICITGTYGTSSLVSRLLYDEFSVLHKPTMLTTIYKEGDYEVVDIPDLNHSVAMKCDILILTCKSQLDVQHLARQWFGYHKHLIVVLIDTKPEKAILCPEEHLLMVNNMTREGLLKLLQLVHAYK